MRKIQKSSIFSFNFSFVKKSRLAKLNGIFAGVFLREVPCQTSVFQIDKEPVYKSRNSGLCISTGTGNGSTSSESISTR